MREWELSLTSKVTIYHATVLTTLLRACETWTFYSRHAKQLNHFHLSCLLRPLHIRWQDKILDTKVLCLAGVSSVHTVLEQAQATWSGHVIRMPDSWLPKQLLYSWRTESGQVQSWGQKKHFKDCLKCPWKAWTSISTPWSCLPCIALPGLGDPQRVLLHQRKDAQQKLRESKLHARDKQPSPPLQHPPTCVSEVGVPFWREQSHQPPLDIHSQIFHLTLKLRSSLTLTNKQHKSKWCISWPYFFKLKVEILLLCGIKPELKIELFESHNYIRNIQSAMPYYQGKGVSTNALNFVTFGILFCQDKKLSIQFEKPNIMKASKEDEGLQSQWHAV